MIITAQTAEVHELYGLLGRQIAHLRRKAGLTQEELAEMTGYSVDFISLVERGVNAPTVKRLQDIAVAVGVEVWQLFYPESGVDQRTKPQAMRAKIKESRKKSKSTK